MGKGYVADSRNSTYLVNIHYRCPQGQNNLLTENIWFKSNKADWNSRKTSEDNLSFCVIL